MAPATPGTVICFVAAVCLALASFSTPLIKSLYFLKASINTDSYSGDLTFGTLGYCATVSGTTTCSSPSVGYELDLSAILSISVVDIPEVVSKWITYVLVLHIVALGIAAIAFVLGLIAHCQQFAMTCLSSCMAGVACSVACIAFIFDIVLFLLARTRINSIGGTSSLGPAVWLTLAGWLCLLFSGCAFGCGRRCIGSRGPRNPDGGARGKRMDVDDRYAEEARIEAIRTEEGRKARQAAESSGFGAANRLPGFQPYSAESQPLTGANHGGGGGRDQWLDDDDGAADPSLAHSQAYRDHTDPSVIGGYPHSAVGHNGGYAPTPAQGAYAAGVGAGGSGLDPYGQALAGPGLQRRSSDAYYASGQQSPGGYPAMRDDSAYYQADPYTNPYDPAPHTQTSGYAPQQQGTGWDNGGGSSSQHGYAPTPSQADYNVYGAGAGVATYGQAPQPTMSPSNADPRRAMQAGFISPLQAQAPGTGGQADDPYGGYAPRTPDPYQPTSSATVGGGGNLYQPEPVRLQHAAEPSTYYDAQDQLAQQQQQQPQSSSAGPSAAPAGGPPSYELMAMDGGAPAQQQSGYAREKMGYQR